MNNKLSLFATCPKGVEDLLASECRQQDLQEIKSANGGVYCQGSLEQAYSLCLWSRTASRVLLKLDQFPVNSIDDLYKGVQNTEWSMHFDHDNSLAIDVHTSHRTINNSHYATLKIKDAIVDQFKQNFGKRPDVERKRPDSRINAYINKDSCTLYLDLSGEPLHIRGYRRESGVAPLKENLAAAILLRAHWPEKAAEGRPLVDPLCGSATLLIEAAYMAAHIAPGLLRDYYGFTGWKLHQADTWAGLLDKAREIADQNRSNVPLLIGVEKSFKVANIARENIKNAGLAELITVKQADSVSVIKELPELTGLIVTNPPYGKRIGESSELKNLYLELGKNLKNSFPGWDVALFTANHELAKFFGLRAHHKNTLYNGPLKCTLYRYHIREESSQHVQGEKPASDVIQSDESAMFTNRLAKNAKHLARWARKENISCYRIYDADIPQYAVAVDRYEDWIHVQEYEPPKTVNMVKAFVRLNEIIDIVSKVLGVPQNRIILKTRKRQSGSDQYTRQNNADEQLIVHESGLQFKLNLKDYLDTGLFLDHRLTRQLLRKLAKDTDFLNLFAYTGTASVYAAAGGARTTTTVDMSNTYIAWARENMALNNMKGKQHEYIREDCLQWLDTAIKKNQKYHLIFLDPPTFSNSKRMDQLLDIKRDHVDLINRTMALLENDGRMIFSCNARGFKLDDSLQQTYAIKDLTHITTTEDYRRKPAHTCWCLAWDDKALRDCKL